MAESTLQEIVGMYRPPVAQNPFGELQKGVETGASLGSQLMQRNLQLKQLGMEMQYKQQELQFRKSQHVFEGFKDLASEQDPIARKMKGEQLKDTLTEMGHGGVPAVDYLMKSDDARQQVLAGMSVDPDLNSGDPQRVQAGVARITGSLNLAGGDPKKNIDIVQAYGKMPEQIAAASMITGRQQQLQTSKSFLDRIKTAIPYAANPDDRNRLTSIFQDPARISNPSTQDLFALASAENLMGQQTVRGKEATIAGKEATTEKAKAETQATPAKLQQGQQRLDIERDKVKAMLGEKYTNRAEKTMKDIEANKQMTGLMNARNALESAQAIIHPGMNFQDFSLVNKDLLVASLRTARPAISAEKGIDQPSLDRDITRLGQYFSSSGSGIVPPAQVAQVSDLLNRMVNISKDSEKGIYLKGLAPRVKTKFIDEDQAKGIYEGHFGETWPGLPAAKAPTHTPGLQKAPPAAPTSTGGVSTAQASAIMKNIMANPAATPDQKARAAAAYRATTGQTWGQ